MHFAARLCFLLATFGMVSCTTPRSVRLRPAGVHDERGLFYLPFASSEVESFTDLVGRPCLPFAGRVRDNLIGWRSQDQDPICVHDTIDDGLKPCELALRWRAELPADGSYDLVTLGYSVGTFGSILSRGSWYGDFGTKAELRVEAQSAHCSATWSFPLAIAVVNGPANRFADYSGWTELPSLVLAGCKAHDPLEVRVLLVGESNRGRVEVEWFGIAAASDVEVNRIFGLRQRRAPAAGQ